MDSRRKSRVWKPPRKEADGQHSLKFTASPVQWSMPLPLLKIIQGFSSGTCNCLPRDCCSIKLYSLHTEETGSKEPEAQAPYEVNMVHSKHHRQCDANWCNRSEIWKMVGFWASPWKTPWSEIQRSKRAEERVLSSTRKSEVAQNWQGPLLFYCEETKPSVTADWRWNNVLEGGKNKQKWLQTFYSESLFKAQNKPRSYLLPENLSTIKISY